MIPAALERFILDRMIATGIPGLSLVLLKGEEMVERHFGFRDLSTRAPPDGNTRFGIGSVTKLFTAIAVLRMVEGGEVGLDDSVGRYLPELIGCLPDGTAIRHLLAHASGLPALGFSETKMSDTWFMNGFPISTWLDLLTYMEGGQEWEQNRPGSSWHYSNESYLILGRLIECVTGENYISHVERSLLEPLRMERSTYDRNLVEQDPNRVAPLQRTYSGQFIPGANLYGVLPSAGGLVSSARDLARLAYCLMHGGELREGSRLYGPVTATLLREVQLPVDSRQETPLSDLPLWSDPRRFQALGPQVIRGLPGFSSDAVGHGGGVMGGTAYVLVAPAEKLGVVLLANSHGYPLVRMAMVALLALHNEPAESLAFVRRERVTESLGGVYSSFRDSIRAELRSVPQGFEMTLCFRPAPRTIQLTLLDHDETAGVTRLLAVGQGRPDVAEIVSRAGSASVELRYERYALRRVGRLT